MLEDIDILTHPCSNVTESEDNPWRDSLRSEGSAEIVLTPLSRRPSFTLWWLGLSQASVQGTRAGSISGTLSLSGREWIATTVKNQFPNLLFVFTWLVGCERALGATCCSTSPCGFLCVPIATAHIWVWRQRWKGCLHHNYVILQLAYKHRGEIQLLKPSLVLLFETPMFIRDISLEPAGMIMRPNPSGAGVATKWNTLHLLWHVLPTSGKLIKHLQFIPAENPI